jgi:hypothetical protein
MGLAGSGLDGAGGVLKMWPHSCVPDRCLSTRPLQLQAMTVGLQRGFERHVGL